MSIYLSRLTYVPNSTAPVFTEQQQHRLIIGPPMMRIKRSLKFDKTTKPIALSTAAVHRAAA